MSVQTVNSNSDIIISTKHVSRDFEFYIKEKGLKGSISNLIHKKKEIKHAVKDLNFEIERGSIVGFIGLNGAGKTTTLKILSGILEPSSGEVDILGYRPSDKKNEYLRKISMVMGNKTQLWWDLPAIDSFELNRQIYSVPEDKFEKTLKELVEVIGVQDLIKTQIRRLSLGERMKMEIIASLIHSPELVFLDEPTIGLDIISQRNIRLFLKEYNKRTKATIILTSHNFDDIVTLCDKLIIINQGEIIYNNSFSNFESEFAKDRIINLKVAEKIDDAYDIIEKELPNVKKVDDTTLRIVVNNDHIVDATNTIMSKLSSIITDINIENISMEDIVSNIYTK